MTTRSKAIKLMEFLAETRGWLRRRRFTYPAVMTTLALAMLPLVVKQWHRHVLWTDLDTTGHPMPRLVHAFLALLWPGILLARDGMHRTWIVGALCLLLLIGVIAWLAIRHARRRLAWLWVPAMALAMSIAYCGAGTWVLTRPVPLPVTTRYDHDRERLAEFLEGYRIGYRYGEMGVWIDALGGNPFGHNAGRLSGSRAWRRLLGRDDLMYWHPLVWAVINGDEREVARWLAAGADVDLRDGIQRTALMTAITHGPASVPMLQLLLRAGADVNAADERGYTALMHAAYMDCPMETFDYLLAAGARIDVAVKYGTPLTFAARSNSVPKVARLLEVAAERGIDLAINDALMKAVEEARPEVVAYLLVHGANANHVDPARSSVLLSAFQDRYRCSCCGEARVKIVRELLVHSADPDTRNAAGHTALMVALNSELETKVEAMRVLLEHGADTELRDHAGRTVLMQAIETYPDLQDQPPVVRLLIAYGALPEVWDDAGISPEDIYKSKSSSEWRSKMSFTAAIEAIHRAGPPPPEAQDE